MQSNSVPKAAATALLCVAAAWPALGRAQALIMGPQPDRTGQTARSALAGRTRAMRSALEAGLGPRVVIEEEDDRTALPLRIAFEPGSARLTVSATHALDRLGQALGSGPLAGDRLRIEGHADATGSPEANADVAERRAMAVAAYLEQNDAISAARLSCVAAPASMPRERVVVIMRLTSG